MSNNTSENTRKLDDGKSEEEKKADGFRLEGNERFRVNDFKKALELYSKSLEAKKTVPALLNRSFSYVKMERFEEALSDDDEALKMDPNNLKGICRRGIALRELGRYSLALKEFGACLEREHGSASFQQLYDQCQALADQKSFVNKTLRIMGYKDTAKSKSEPSELKLELVDGLLSYAHIKYEAQRFRSLTHLEAYIKEHVKGAFGSIRVEDTVVDEELMQFFRSLDPAMLASIHVEFFNVGCSRAYFAELFDGRLFRPLSIWFSEMERNEMDMTTALRSLATVRNAMTIQLGETRFERFYNIEKVPPKGQKSNANLLDVDTVLELLHQPLPDIPAHNRMASTIFDQRRSVPERALTAFESVAIFRGMAGRAIIIDLDHFGGDGDGGGDGKLAEIIQKCTQRFQSARSPVSYMFNLRIPYPPQSHLSRADLATFSAIAERERMTVLRNDLGEQFALGAFLDEFKAMSRPISGDHKIGEKFVAIAIQRVRTPPPPKDDKR